MKAVNKARKEGDEKQLDKLMRRQGAVMKMNTRASLETLKTMPFTLIPFYLIYTVVRVAFNDLAVAYAPFVFLNPALFAARPPVLTLSYCNLIGSLPLTIP